MAVGDIKEIELSTLAGSANTNINFLAAPSEDDLVILFFSSHSSRTILTPPSGYTEIEPLSVADPRLVVYAKVAGASESTDNQLVWSGGAQSGGLGYVIEGPLTLGAITSGVNHVASDQTSHDIPSSALSSVGSGLAIACLANKGAATAHAMDNSFTFIDSSTSASMVLSYGDKTIAHSDTDIQTTATWTTAADAASAMIVIDFGGGAGGGTILPFIQEYYRGLN